MDKARIFQHHEHVLDGPDYSALRNDIAVSKASKKRITWKMTHILKILYLSWTQFCLGLICQGMSATMKRRDADGCNLSNEGRMDQMPWVDPLWQSPITFYERLCHSPWGEKWWRGGISTKGWSLKLVWFWNNLLPALFTLNATLFRTYVKSYRKEHQALRTQ